MWSGSGDMLYNNHHQYAQCISNDILPCKMIADNNIRQSRMLKTYQFHKIEILQRFNDIRKYQDRNSHFQYSRLPDTPHHTIQQYHYQEVSGIRTDKSIMHIQGNQYFNDKQGNGKGAILSTKSEHAMAINVGLN